MKPLDLSTVIAVLAPLAIVVHWLWNASSDVTNRNWNGLLSRAWAFLVAWGVVVVAAHSSLNLGGSAGKGLAVLHSLGWGDELLIALFITATAGSILADGLQRALNRADPTVKQTLVPPSSTTSSLEAAAAATADLPVDLVEVP